MASSMAFAQSNQGQAAGQAGVNGNAPTATDSTKKREGAPGGSGNMTTGTNTGSPNGSPNAMSRSQNSPTGSGIGRSDGAEVG